ncbi:MAG: MATE family efflux transporter [Halolamina sp.]
MEWSRLHAVWRRVLSLGWPVMAEQTFRTAMRTTDVLVTATFSPAAVVAIGLADLYARFPLRVGLGLGGGAIALSSQDTGADAAATRDEAITQALLLGVVAGVPFTAAGWLFGEEFVALLGAGERAVALGGTYLAIIYATAPARHVALVGARSLQGTGDTRTPMYINVASNALNVAGSVVFGLGLLGMPELGVRGVGYATAFGNAFTAAALVAALLTDRTEASFVRPRDATVARQLVRVSLPRIGEGLAATLAEFPFNAILLGFGTAVNAGFQIGRRLYQQVTAPLSRGYNVAASVVVGQRLGEGDAEAARFEGWAIVGLGLATVGVIGLVLAVAADPLVRLFTDDAATVGQATAFARVYGVTGTALVAFTVLSGSLQGASETRIPFAGRVSGVFVFMLGGAYVVGDLLGYGAVGGYVGVGASYIWMALVVAYGFARSDWAGRAAGMMAERGTAESEAEADAEADD